MSGILIQRMKRLRFGLPKKTGSLSVMLSAIAARKVAQAARQLPASSEQTIEVIPNSSIHSPPSSPQNSPPPARHSSKRKPRSQSSGSLNKKNRKIRHLEDKRPRYFAGDDAFQQEDDVIIIDRDDSDEEIGLPDPPKVSASANVIPSRKPPWPPSLPMHDSSDEESDAEEDEPDIPDISLVKLPSPSSLKAQPSVLSTFQPIPEKNVFYLSPDEIITLGLSTHTKDMVTVLALAPTETISLLGTYAFSLVHGSVSLSGVTLATSPIVHRVFAPRSSPIPIFKCLVGDTNIPSPNISSLPRRLHLLFQSDGAIIVLRQLRTGVEGLGRICRTFDRIFELSRWQKSHEQPHLGVSGVHMVRCYSLYFVVRLCRLHS